MRILVAGARGYVGSRLIPELLARGHQVTASASRDPGRTKHAWGPLVDWARMEATDAGEVAAAVGDVDAVCYLVHALDQSGFADKDRRAAEVMREAVTEAGVPRLVYLSGLVPEAADDLSPHLASRLEVEQILLSSGSATASLRAGVVLGAGSTSFEIIRQIAAANLVLPVPRWLRSQVQPIGITDTVAHLAHALEDPSIVGDLDIGGPDAVPYGDLIGAVANEAGLTRVRVTVPGLPAPVVTAGAPWVCAAPAGTVRALMESLRHEMVCRPGHHWTLPHAATPLTTAIRASLGLLADADLAAHRASPGDPSWTRSSLIAERVLGRRLPLPELVRAWGHLGEHRATGLLPGERVGRWITG